MAVSSVVVFVVSHRYLDRAGMAAAERGRGYDDTLARWAAAPDLRDRSTAQHTARVTELTCRLAARFGLVEEAREDVRRGPGAGTHVDPQEVPVLLDVIAGTSVDHRQPRRSRARDPRPRCALVPLTARRPHGLPRWPVLA